MQRVGVQQLQPVLVPQHVDHADRGDDDVHHRGRVIRKHPELLDRAPGVAGPAEQLLRSGLQRGAQALIEQAEGAERGGRRAQRMGCGGHKSRVGP